MAGPVPQPVIPPEQYDQPITQDLQTLANHQTDPATRASQMLNANPKLVNDPVAAKALLSQPNADGHTTGQASKFVDQYGFVQKGTAQALGSTHPAARGFFGNLLHGVAGLCDGVRHDVASIPRGGVNAVTGIPGAAEGIAGNAWDGAKNWFETVGGMNGHGPLNTNPVTNNAGEIQGVKDLGKMVASGVKRAGIISTELGSFGQVNPAHLNDNNPNIGKNYAEGLAGLTNTVNSTINPFTTWRNMGHFGAFFESLARRRGLGYAIQYALPFLLAGGATHDLAVGIGGAAAPEAAVAPEAAAVAPEAAAAVPETVSIDGKTTTSIPFEQTAPQAEPGTIPTEAAAAPARSAVFRGASAVSNVATSPLRAISAVASRLGTATGGLRLNAMYELAGAAAKQDPELASLWNQTSNGVPVDEYGRPIGNVGSVIAKYLGLPQGFFFKAMAAPIDIYANYLGADPLGSVGKVIGATRTFDSTGGIVGRFFGGMGIHSGEDVYRVASQYQRVDRAFQWLANHSNGQILEQ